MSTYGYDDGLIRGKHKVTVESLDERNHFTLAVPKLYRRPETSPLAIDTELGAFQSAFGRGAEASKILVQMGMGCSVFGPNWQQTMRSQHSGGGHIAMLDGSVHFLSDDIEISQNGECWYLLNR